MRDEAETVEAANIVCESARIKVCGRFAEHSHTPTLHSSFSLQTAQWRAVSMVTRGTRALRRQHPVTGNLLRTAGIYVFALRARTQNLRIACL